MPRVFGAPGSGSSPSVSAVSAAVAAMNYTSPAQAITGATVFTIPTSPLQPNSGTYYRPIGAIAPPSPGMALYYPPGTAPGNAVGARQPGTSYVTATGIADGYQVTPNPTAQGIWGQYVKWLKKMATPSSMSMIRHGQLTPSQRRRLGLSRAPGVRSKGIESGTQEADPTMTPTTADVAATTDDSGMSTGMMIALALALVVVGGGAAYFGKRKKRHHTSEVRTNPRRRRNTHRRNRRR